jgi:Rrf2 family protein
MKFSTRTRYGLRFLVYLALQGGDRYVQLSEAAEREGISHKYLEQIVRLLRPAGLLRSQRGARGGYALAREPEQIDLEELFTYLEGDLAPIACPEVGDVECSRYEYCSTAELWGELETQIRSFLRARTLEDLAAKVRARQGTEMFYI